MSNADDEDLSPQPDEPAATPEDTQANEEDSPQPNEPAATPEQTRDYLFTRASRWGPRIERSFVQAHDEGNGDRDPGPLADFVRARRLLALQLWLLFHSLALQDPWHVELVPVDTFARALGKTNAGAESSVSRNITWLREKKLITTKREKRMTRVHVLAQDGSGTPFQRPESRFFVFPSAFFKQDWHTRLDLAATATLIVGLRRERKNGWFTLSPEREADWAGISADTLLRGLDQLRETKALEMKQRWVRSPKARGGRVLTNFYRPAPELDWGRRQNSTLRDFAMPAPPKEDGATEASARHADNLNPQGADA